ncbi:unnamed protein product [Urochloa decumbens]|uniref:DUF1618 domain-containing protein n=1 Tax=Urochloa decumbens TaxID=240449 RepID=A0ABC8XIJ8_9POAL
MAAAAAAAALPPWVVLEHHRYAEVSDSAPDAPAREWATVDCARRTAYGCGEHGQRILDGLTLYVRRLINWPASDDLSTTLHIQVSSDARRGLAAEFGEGGGDPLHIDGEEFYAVAFVDAAGEHLLLLTVVFRLHDFVRRTYYLIYNAADTSLSMVPCAPDEHPIAGLSTTLRPLPVRRDDGGGYGLAVLATRQVPPAEEEGEEGFATLEDVLCVWTPAAEEEKEEPPCDVRPRWQGLLRRPLARPPLLRPARGRHRQLRRGFPLRPLAGIDPGGRDQASGEDHAPRRRRRQVVCIDSTRRRRYGDATVALWTLDLDRKEWRKDTEFKARDLWRMKGSKEARMPRMEAKCPFLMPDGTLCLLLPNKRRRMEDSPDDYICCIDLDSMSILWSRRLRGYCHNEPAILPSGFFKKLLRPLVPSKGELSSICVEEDQD